jgi:hypothetical protein
MERKIIRRISPMHCSPARWTSALAAAALIALPAAASAQTPPPATPPTQQATPQTPPSQPPADPKPADPKPAEPQAQPPQDAKVDAAAAKEHLSQARDALSKLTSLPEAAKLEGEARTQVSQLISNFNELITTQADWRAAYAKVDSNLTTLLGPASPDQTPPATGVSGAVGTSGTGGVQLDPAIRGKLAEFRTHLKEFERAAGGASGAMAPSAATDATANPANPNPATPANPANPPSAAANPPTPMITSSPTTSMAPADQAKAAEQVAQSEADKHLDAISAILNESKTGTLTKAQTTELKKHVAELRQLLQKK